MIMVLVYIYIFFSLVFFCVLSVLVALFVCCFTFVVVPRKSCHPDMVYLEIMLQQQRYLLAWQPRYCLVLVRPATPPPTCTRLLLHNDSFSLWNFLTRG